MKLTKIAKTEIRQLLQQSVKDWQVYTPVETQEGDILFSTLPGEGCELNESLDRVRLGDENVVISPKDIFFPQMETMFNFDKDDIRQEINTTKKLIFGVKPCDARAILFADEFFKRNFEDIYYLSRAKDRLIVTIGCLTPPRPAACFCTSAGSGPFLEKGYDLQMADAGDCYLVEAGSEKGEAFLQANSALFKDAEDSEADRLKTIKSGSAKAVELKVDFEKAVELMKNNGNFEENYKRIAERCIYCGGCVYTCPTCTCFNVLDDKKGDKGARRRNWDACMFAGYTRETSTHNPRNEKWVRAARRYEHKLKYDVQTAGASGCIACGRCLETCPVNIGMSKFIEEITQNKRTM
jgi:ferredoxin